MEMDFNAYLASSDEDCDDQEVWPAVGEGNRNLTEEEKIAKYRVRLYLLLEVSFNASNFNVQPNCHST